VASRSGDKPRPSLHKYKQNFKLITFPISDKSRASPFLETAVLVAQLQQIYQKTLAKNLERLYF
jgi:hypothetical protein